MIDKNILGKNIRENRIKKQMTLEQLSERLDVTDNYLGKIERGNNAPSLDVIVKIAQLLEVSVDSLLFEYDYNNKEYQFLKSLMDINELTKENKERFIDFINTNIKYFK